jgi:hypothetical protein
VQAAELKRLGVLEPQMNISHNGTSGAKARLPCGIPTVEDSGNPVFSIAFTLSTGTGSTVGLGRFRQPDNSEIGNRRGGAYNLGAASCRSSVT